MNDNSCIFCRIARKQAPASFVYEDASVMAFLDIRPLNMGHTLVIPKEHYETIYEIPDELIGHIHTIVKRTALALKKATEADGITVIQQNGRAAGQEIFHLHVHVVPRYMGQKLPRFEEIQEANREKLNQAAEKIRQHLK
jgi:histidine triad (HIT) family protein